MCLGILRQIIKHFSELIQFKRYSGSEWKIMGDRSVAQSASVSQRYNGLVGIIKDVFLLSECDYVVCTFSSQVKD